jgi:hypothetical protein
VLVSREDNRPQFDPSPSGYHQCGIEICAKTRRILSSFPAVEVRECMRCDLLSRRTLNPLDQARGEVDRIALLSLSEFVPIRRETRDRIGGLNVWDVGQ